MLDILSHVEGARARRVQAFILRESTESRMPTAAMWCGFWCLVATPRGMTDGKVGDWVWEMGGHVEGEVFGEGD